MPPHWTQTPNGAMLARATSFVFSTIISPESEGGCKEFLEANCAIFADWTEDSEQLLQYSVLFSQFEARMERALEDFAEKEGEAPQEIVCRIASIADGDDSRAAQQVRRLLGGVDYRRFCGIMKTRAADLLAQLTESLSPLKGKSQGKGKDATPTPTVAPTKHGDEGNTTGSGSRADGGFKGEGAKEAWWPREPSSDEEGEAEAEADMCPDSIPGPRRHTHMEVGSSSGSKDEK